MQWKPGLIFGVQIVTTLWMLLLGVLLLGEDKITGLVLVGGCGLLNLVALGLWLTRSDRDAFGSMKQFLWITTPVYAAVCLTIYWRSSSGEWKSGPSISEGFPYWIVAVPPVMVLVLKGKERE